jgi:hypothetical protein
MRTARRVEHVNAAACAPGPDALRSMFQIIDVKLPLWQIALILASIALISYLAGIFRAHIARLPHNRFSKPMR